jgi:adenine-specific DNA-methyltransferase
MIKYIGSKRLLIPTILGLARGLPDIHSVLDLFSGTARVGHAFKRAGYRVTANDHLRFAYTIARCYVATDARHVRCAAQELLRELALVPPREGYFTDTFCRRSRFFHPKNGARVDAIREAIAAMQLSPDLEAVALVALMEAADRVDSTTGVQMAYLKDWAPRALKDLELRLPHLLDGQGLALNQDAVEAAAHVECDLAYVDPPYNQHSYLGNYHVWESLVVWDKPEVYGVACKRVQCKGYRSPFNSKKGIHSALRQVIAALRARFIIVSFNDEGHVTREEMEGLLSERGSVAVLTTDYKRYVGAQIGIFNPRGEKVGQVSHLRNKEFLYLVGEDAGVLEHAVRQAHGGSMQTALFG